MSNEHANFDGLVTQYGATLYRYVARHLDDRSVCEDVVNETFTIAWRHRSQIPELNQELAWLYAIAFRVLSNQRRSRDRRNRLLEKLALERDQSSPSDDSDLTGLSWGLERLDESEQHLLILVYWERLTYRQIAFVLDISENAVGIRINRIKKKLKGIIDASSGVVVEDSPAVEEDEQ